MPDLDSAIIGSYNYMNKNLLQLQKQDTILVHLFQWQWHFLTFSVWHVTSSFWCRWSTVQLTCPLQTFYHLD